MGYSNSYSSSKTSGGSSKTTSYESGKVSSPTSPKSNGYDSSKVSAPSSSSSSSAKGKLGDIKRLLVSYLDLCQEIENKEAELEKLKVKRDELKEKIAAHPQAATITDILSTMKGPKNSTKR